MSAAVLCEGLTKKFRKTVAVARLDLEIQQGRVFGFIGPNGAGKTTTIRMLLGLARPTEGRAVVLGAEMPGEFSMVNTRVGGVWETPGFYPTVSARNNLRLLALSSGSSRPVSRIDDLLERVGLADRTGDRVGKFSHGMRQRLGLAAALLHDPELLVLDEPHTGLDPTGIRDFRNLVADLGREGRTVFFSSHVLSEVEQVCDEVAFLRKGELVGRYGVEEARRNTLGVRVTIDELGLAADSLTNRGWKVDRQQDHLVVEGATRDEVRDHLVDGGFRPAEVTTLGIPLEQLYTELVEKE